MKTAVLIVGLPASGKTHYAKKTYPNHIIIDDPRDLDSDVIKIIKENPYKDIVVVDPHFCYSDILLSAKKIIASFGFSIEYVYFENNIVRCLRNSTLRKILGDSKKVELFIVNAAEKYTVPQGFTPIPVW